MEFRKILLRINHGFTKGTLKMERNKEKGYLLGKTELCILVALLMIR
jgi:hypothetical protein